ncbi:hypothetical protein BH20ACT24_BH20ACT24_22650 [soil metagenome]
MKTQEERQRAQEFTEFYKASFPQVIRASSGLVDRDDAFDVAQEAFARTWSRWSGVRGNEVPVAYTLKIVLNLARRRWRTRLANRRLLQRLGPERHGDDGTETADLRVSLEPGLNALSLRQRQAVVLLDQLGLPPAEAAQIMGVSKSTLRVHLSRARRRLRADLGETIHPSASDTTGVTPAAKGRGSDV